MSSAWRAIVDAFQTLFLSRDNEVVRAVGPAPRGGDFVEIVVEKGPLREAMWIYSRNILLLSVIISCFTAALVYFTLHYMFVRPMHRITRNITQFRRDPENSCFATLPPAGPTRSASRERELTAMQRDLTSMLHQKSQARRARTRGFQNQSRPAQSPVLGTIVFRSDRRIARSQGSAIRAETDALARTRHRVLPIDPVLWRRA